MVDDGGGPGHGGVGRPGRKPAGNGGLEVREERSDGILFVAPVGRVDSGTAGTLESRLLERLAQGERRVVIDLADVQYISSAGLRILLLVLNKLKAVGGRLALCSMGRSVGEVFELAGFTTIFAIESSPGARAGPRPPTDDVAERGAVPWPTTTALCGI